LAIQTHAHFFCKVLLIVLSVVLSTAAAQEQQPKPEPPLTYVQLRAMAEDGVTGSDIMQEADLRSLNFVLSGESVKELLQLGVEPHVIHHLTIKCLPLKSELDALVKNYIEQRYNRTIELAGLLLDKAPKVLLARWLRGQCQIENREWAAALADFEWLNVESPDYFPRYTFIDRPVRPVVMIARVHRLSESPQQAVTALNRHLIEHPFSAESDVFLERALAHAALQQMSLARADFLASLKADPIALPVYLNAAEILTTCRSNRDANSGRSLALAAVELASDSSDRHRAYAAVAAAEAELANFDAAVDWQQRAVAGAPIHLRKELEDRVAVYRRRERPWPGVIAETGASPARKADVFTEFRKSLVEIKGGRFRMGSDRGAPDESPIREVEVADFLLGRCEVTRGGWRNVMGEGPATDSELPMEGVSWEQCQTFIERLNRLAIDAPVVFRLPTEAEWEFAARGKTDTVYFFGDDPLKLSEYAWFSENSNKALHPVGTLKPNAAGLFDLYGNVEEWCADAYIRSPQNSEEKSREPGIVKVLRGGSWMNSAARCTSSARSAAPAKERRRGAGFRLAANQRPQSEPGALPVTTASEPQTVTMDLLDEAAEALWTQFRDAPNAGLRSLYRTRMSRLSFVIGYTRLAEEKPEAALASFRKVLALSTDQQGSEGWQARCIAAWIQATCPPELKLVYDPSAAAEAATAAMGQTEFKEWFPYAVLAAAHAENGDFEKAVLRAQQALDQAPADMRDDCRARLMNYKGRRSSRGTRPPLALIKRS
jgi:formylglycine-generating enzyme required for sulfatase activity